MNGESAMLNSDHSSPPNADKTVMVWKVTLDCPTKKSHVMYLTMDEPPEWQSAVLNWFGAQLASASGGRVYAEPIVEVDLADLPDFDDPPF